jgi:hypothetical protein
VYVVKLSGYWNAISTPAGLDVSQIRTPGTAAQTRIVRIISHTAVIFSTIDSIHLEYVI